MIELSTDENEVKTITFKVTEQGKDDETNISLV